MDAINTQVNLTKLSFHRLIGLETITSSVSSAILTRNAKTTKTPETTEIITTNKPCNEIKSVDHNVNGEMCVTAGTISKRTIAYNQ